MAAVGNSFEGITPAGTAISAANSGGTSGNAFDFVGVNSGTLVSASGGAHGSLCASVQNPAAASTFVQWTSAGAFGAQTSIYFRAYVKISANPGASLRLFNSTTGGGSIISVSLTTAGKLSVTYSSSGTAFVTFTAAVPVGSWFRIEGFAIVSATAGQVSASLFSSAMDGTTPDETHTSASTLNTGTLSGTTTYSFGDSNAIAMTSAILFDDIGLSSAGPVGPYIGGGAALAGTGSLSAAGSLAAGGSLAGAGSLTAGGGGAGAVPVTGTVTSGISTANTTSQAIANPAWTGSASTPGVLLVMYATTTAASVTFSCTGFTAVTAGTGQNVSGQLLYRVTDGTEGSSFTVAVSVTHIVNIVCIPVTGQAAASSGFDPSAPSSSGAYLAVPGTAVTSPSVTTAASGDLLIWIGVSRTGSGGGAAITLPSGFTQVSGFTPTASGTTGATTLINIGTATQGTAGATGTQSGTMASANGGAVLVAVAGAAPPAGAASLGGAGSLSTLPAQAAGTSLTASGSLGALPGQAAGTVLGGTGSVITAAQGAQGAATLAGTGSLTAPSAGSATAVLGGAGSVSAPSAQSAGTILGGAGSLAALPGLNLRAAATATTGGGSATLALPAPPLAAGDLILIWVACGYVSMTWTSAGGDSLTAETASSPSSGTTGLCSQLFHKIADSGDVAKSQAGGSYTITQSVSHPFSGMICVVPVSSAAHPFDPSDAPGSGTPAAASVSVTAAGVTTANAGDLLVWLGAARSSAGAAPPAITVPSGFSVPAGVSQASSSGTGVVTNTGVTVAIATQGTAGATGNPAGSIGSSQITAGLLLAVKAVPAIPLPGTVSQLVAGAPTSSSVQVVAKTTGATSCRLAYSTSSGMTSPSYVTAQVPDSLGYVRYTVTGLAAHTRYYVQIADTPSGGTETPVGVTGACKTLPAAGTAQNFTAALVSCIAEGDVTSPAQDVAIADWISYDADLNIFTGDFDYTGTTSTVLGTQVGVYESQISSIPSLPAMVSTRWGFYCRSDHEAGPDNGDSNNAYTATNIAAAQQVFPFGTLGDTVNTPVHGLYQAWVIGRVRFIMLDIRNTDRSPGSNTDNGSKTMLGATQLAWLEAQLIQPEPLKVIISDVAWMGPASITNGPDKWWSYDTERQAILTYIAANAAQVQNLMLWHGDSHLVGCTPGSGNTWGGFPVYCAAPLLNVGGGLNTSTFTHFYSNSGGECRLYGRIAFTDSGTSIAVAFQGWDAVAGIAQVSQTDTFSTIAPGAAALGGAGSIGTAAVIRPGAALAAAGSASTPAVVQQATTVTAAGSLAAGSALRAGSALAGAAQLAGTAVLVGAGPLAGAGSLSAGGAVTVPGTGPLAGAGSLADAATVRAGTALAGTGTLSADSTATAAGALAGAGSLSAGGAVTVPGTGPLAGTGTLSAGSAVPGTGLLSGTGSLSAGGGVPGFGVTTFSTGASTTSSAVSVPVPAGTAAGDQLVIWVLSQTASMTFSSPGWTAATAATGQNASAGLLYKTADPGDAAAGGSGTWTLTASAAHAMAGIAANISGAVFDPSPSGSGTLIATPATTFSVPGVTTTAAGDLLLWFGGARTGSGAPPSITPPSGFTAAGQAATSVVTFANVGVLLAVKTQAVAGATGSLAGTYAASADGGGLLIAVTQPSSVPGAAVLPGSASFGDSGTSQLPGAALAGSGSVTSGIAIAAGATLGAAGQVSAAATAPGGSVLAGAGSIGSPVAVQGAPVTLAAAGHLAAGISGQLAGASLAGSAALTAAGQVAAGASLAGAAVLAAVTAASQSGQLAGAGSLVSGTVLAAGAILGGTGTLTAGASAAVPGGASLGAAGTLAASPAAGAGTVLTGTGSAGTPATSAGPGAVLSGAGSVTAAQSGTVPGMASLGGSGLLSCPARQGAGTALGASGLLASGGSGSAVALLAGQGVLSAPVGVVQDGSVLPGAGSLAGPLNTALAGAVLASAGSLTAGALVPAGAVLPGTGLVSGYMTQASSLAGTGSLGTGASRTLSAVALAGTGLLAGRLTALPVSLLSGAGSMTAAGAGQLPGAAALRAAGVITGTVAIHLPQEKGGSTGTSVSRPAASSGSVTRPYASGGSTVS